MGCGKNMHRDRALVLYMDNGQSVVGIHGSECFEESNIFIHRPNRLGFGGDRMRIAYFAYRSLFAGRLVLFYEKLEKTQYMV